MNGLGRRAVGLTERMDEPDCDPLMLRRTYAQFELVNRYVSGWQRIFAKRIAPLADGECTLLDIGCGGGDLARRMTHWAQRSGVRLRVTGVDPDPRALEFALSRPLPSGLDFRRATAEELAEAGESFDFVVSNHVLHHVEERRLGEFLAASGALARRLALHNDLARHPLAWLALSLTRPLFRRSFIVSDGLRSIRRSYTPDELRRLAPPGWRVETMAPFRNLLLAER